MTLPKTRLLALDVMRGMTIFFMIIVNTPGSWNFVYGPLTHASWNGCTPTDLVFPFFVFIVGVSMAYSFRKYDQAERSTWIRKILRRTLLIFLIGLFLNAYPLYDLDISSLRIFGVLQRIALAYGIAALLVVFFREKLLPIIFIGILLGYWAILLLFGGSQPLSLEENAVRLLDLWLFGADHLYQGYGLPFDPEGLLSSLPAAGTAIFGYLVGRKFQQSDVVTSGLKTIAPWGIGALVLGVIWNFIGFPINKPIWSSSYVLFAGGLATLFFIALIWIIDVQGYKKWTYVFRVFGLNPLISYALSGLIITTFSLIKIGDTSLYPWLYQEVFSKMGSHFGSLIQALTYTMFIWLFAWQLYRRGKVIKV